MEGAVPFLPHVASATSRGPVAPGGPRGVSWRRGRGRATWTGPRMVGAALGLGVVADLEAARRSYEAAASQGFQPAEAKLAGLHGPRLVPQTAPLQARSGA